MSDYTIGVFYSLVGGLLFLLEFGPPSEIVRTLVYLALKKDNKSSTCFGWPSCRSSHSTLDWPSFICFNAVSSPQLEFFLMNTNLSVLPKQAPPLFQWFSHLLHHCRDALLAERAAQVLSSQLLGVLQNYSNGSWSGEKSTTPPFPYWQQDFIQSSGGPGSVIANLFLRAGVPASQIVCSALIGVYCTPQQFGDEKSAPRSPLIPSAIDNVPEQYLASFAMLAAFAGSPDAFEAIVQAHPQAAQISVPIERALGSWALVGYCKKHHLPCPPRIGPWSMALFNLNSRITSAHPIIETVFRLSPPACIEEADYCASRIPTDLKEAFLSAKENYTLSLTCSAPPELKTSSRRTSL